jgi:hypothetical protein
LIIGFIGRKASQNFAVNPPQTRIAGTKDCREISPAATKLAPPFKKLLREAGGAVHFWRGWLMLAGIGINLANQTFSRFGTDSASGIYC